MPILEHDLSIPVHRFNRNPQLLLAAAIYLAALGVGMLALASRASHSIVVAGPVNYVVDVAADKYATRAAWDGYGGSRPLSELTDHYGAATIDYQPPAPRTPGALLIQLPLMAVPDDALLWTMGVVSLLSLLVVCFATSLLANIPLWVTGTIALTLAGTHPMTNAYDYGNSGVFVAALTVLAWLYHEKRLLAGSLLALAVVVKPWPLFVVITMLSLKPTRAAAIRCIAFAILLTCGGLLLPGVSLGGSIGSLQWGIFFQTIGWNTSLARFLGSPLSLIFGSALLGLIVLSISNATRRIGAAIVAALLTSPISWPWYWIAVIPSAAILAKELVVSRPDKSQAVTTKIHTASGQ